MHPYTHTPLSRLKRISAAVMFACLLPVGAQAASLGKLTVLSAIGQPLNAEIELLAISDQDKQTMQVRLASPQAFSEASVELNPVLRNLQFAIESRGKTQVVRVTSIGAFNEPFVDLLLELSGSGVAHAVREYSFLLDAPRSARVPAQVTGPVAATTTRAVVASDEKTASAPMAEKTAKAKSKAASKVASSKQPATAKSAYTVKPGDSLSAIANKMRPAGVSLDQMLVSMYRANPSAFIGENMSRMRAGSILNVPDAAAAANVAATEATGVVVAQAEDFDRYRKQLAGRIAVASAKPTAATAQAGGGKISAKVEERASRANQAKDRLQLSKAGGSEAAGGMSSEDRIAADKTAAESASRIKDLEKNVADLQKLLEIKNRNLAELSAKKDVAETPAAVAAPAVPAATPADAVPAAAPAPAAVAPPAEATAAVVAKPVLAPPLPAPGIFDDWRENPMLLPGGSALIVILLAWALYRARRKLVPADKGAAEETSVPLDQPNPGITNPAPGLTAAPVALETATTDTASTAAEQLAANEGLAAAEASAEAVEHDVPEALNIDLSRLEQPAAETPPVVVASADMNKLDFDLELDPNLHPVQTAEDELPAIDLAAGLAAQQAARNLSEPPAAVVPPVVSAPVPAAVEAPVGLPPAVEGLSLDLTDPAAGDDEAAGTESVEEIDDESSSFSKEINTKLDLAAAYQEIGDKDGARELLDEVLKAGNQRQVAKAQEMLERLA